LGWLFSIVQLTVAAFLIIGILSAGTAVTVAYQDVAQTVVIVYLIVLILITFGAIYTNNRHRAETELYPFVLPFLLALVALFLSVMTNIVLLCLFSPVHFHISMILKEMY
jgi:hypothetical protein